MMATKNAILIVCTALLLRAQGGIVVVPNNVGASYPIINQNFTYLNGSKAAVGTCPSGQMAVGVTATGISCASPGTIAGTLVTPEEYGADPTGRTDSTAAIQTAVDASSAVYFQGTYLVKPTTHGSSVTAVILSTGAHLGGPGTIKVANSAGDYDSLFQGNACDGCVIEGITIDSNIANNPIASQAAILAHPRIEIGLNGSGILVNGVTIKNSSAVQNIYIGSMGGNTVVNNSLYALGDDPNHIGHDISTIYLGPMVGSTGGDVVANNKVLAVSFAAPAATQGSCYEMHGSYWAFTGNTCYGFGNGLNFTGIDYQDDVSNVATGNSFVIANTCILVWSLQFSTHTTGYGINGGTIKGNNCTIHQVGHDNPWYGGTTGGVAEYAGNNLPLNGLDIEGNTLIYDLETSSRSTSFASVGIGMPIGLTTATSTNGIIANNFIENAPTTAISLSGASQNWKIGPNLIVNAGASQDATVSAAYKIPILLDLTAGASNIEISHNDIIDSLTTSVMQHAFSLGCASATTGVRFLDNQPLLTGTTTTSWVSYFQQYDNNCNPFVRMVAESKPWTTPVGDTMQAGSTIYDHTIPIGYSLLADGVSFTRSDVLSGASLHVTGNAALDGQTCMNGATAGGYYFGSSAHQNVLLESPYDNIVSVRNIADTADAAITAAAATFSGNLTDTIGFTTLNGLLVQGMFFTSGTTAEAAWNPDLPAVKFQLPGSGDPETNVSISALDVLVSGGIVMKDTATGTCYRVKITSGVLVSTSITCPTGF